MEIWTTFTPSKISWEITCVQTKGKLATSDWQKNIKLIDTSLKKLKKAGLSGIRLVIYPSELTQNGKIYKWDSIEKMLDMCYENKLKVDLCIGPFQYPNYPGIYLPKGLLNLIFDNKNCIDTTIGIWKYGIFFLKTQIDRYGKDNRIHGFHLANEWPDSHIVSGKKDIKKCVSLAFMLEVSRYLKENTNKQILLNTNIEASDRKRLKNTFSEILSIFGPQGSLGFDIYPSQFTFRKNFFKKMLYAFWKYPIIFKKNQKVFNKTKLYFAEVEAQPWGGGQSWYQLIKQEAEPNLKVLKFYNNSLQKTYSKYIRNSGCTTVSLWGSDFWLAADAMGIYWPLKQIKSIFG